MPSALANPGHSSNSSLRLPFPRLAESSFSGDGKCIVALTDEGLFEACGTRIAFTQRSGGFSQSAFDSLNLSSAVGDDLDFVSSNRALLCSVVGNDVGTDCLIVPQQVHGVELVEVHDAAEAREAALEGADGIVCARPDVPVLLCFADCVPVILVAPDGSFAVLHSGWRGTIGSIAGIGLQRLCAAASCGPEEVNCYVGPHIGACCYEVSQELIDRFIAAFGPSCDAGNRHLDLSAAVKAALTVAGARESRIVISQDCTSCRHDLYYSYRAEDGVTGRHGAFAVRKGES